MKRIKERGMERYLKFSNKRRLTLGFPHCSHLMYFAAYEWGENKNKSLYVSNKVHGRKKKIGMNFIRRQICKYVL